MRKKKGFSTRSIHSLEGSDTYNALVEPVYLTSTYTFESAEEALTTFQGQNQRMVYGRVHNPTQQVLEKQIADLENGEECVVLGSGMAAISAVILTLLSQGDELVVHNMMYGNSYTLLVKELQRFGIMVKLADFTDPNSVALQISDRTKAVFFEIPTNPLLEVIDVTEIKKVVGDKDIAIIVDATLASPAIINPISLGATFVVHSLTKYIGGHGDLIGGAVVGSQESVNQVRMRGLRYLTGATLSPISCYLALRGIKTLSIRMEKHSENAKLLADYLEWHSKIDRFYYPGLATHPQNSLSRKIMKMPGGVLSMEVAGGFSAARVFINSLQLCKHAVSLGEATTLVQHPASMTHSHYSEEEQFEIGIKDNLIRISVGLEDPEDIIADVEQALSRLA